MPEAVIGGNVRYPTLQGICDLFRSQINDTFSNSSGSGTGQGGGAGLVMNNLNPDVLTFLNAACLDMFAELRTVGAPELLLDNYTLLAIPALGTVDPSIQVALSYAGYFNGFTWSNQWTLPIGLSRMIAVRQRQTNSGFGFRDMTHYSSGLPSVRQGTEMTGWEMRQGLLWMSGALQEVDLSLRCRITFPPFLSTAAQTIDFSTAYVPILDSLNAIAAKMLVLYARRFAPEMLPVAKDAEATYMGKLRLESVRERQSEDNEVSAFGQGAMSIFPGAWVQL